MDARIDHRTLQAQGIDREPNPHIPRAAFEMERHGYRSFVAERIRAEHRVRVEKRAEQALARNDPLAQDVEAQVQSLDDIRREARENWLRAREQGHSTLRGVERSHDDDLGR